MIGPQRRALCIGIDDYPHLKPWEQLKGCVNDARLAADVLQTTFGFLPEHVRLLLNEEASREGILAAFDRLVQETGESDVVVVHYSGHGSWAWNNDGGEEDGKDETIMPWDSGRGSHPNLDILDNEIHLFLVALTQRTPHVTFVFDSCHSGGITREVGGSRARAVPGASKGDPQPPRVRQEVVARTRGAGGGGTGPGPSGFMSGLGARYVLVAGCRNEEKSYEHPGEGGVDHGAMSFHFYGALASISSTTTYGDVFERVYAAVTGANDKQHPQLEGAVNRVIFGVETVEPLRYLLVSSRSGDEVVISGGAAHGVREGSSWSILAPGDRGEGEVLGSVEVTEVRATESTARIVEESAPGSSVQAACRVMETAHPWADFRMPVHAVPGPGHGELRGALHSALEASFLLRPVVDPEEARVLVHLLEPSAGDRAEDVPDGQPPSASMDPPPPDQPPSIPDLAEPAWVTFSRVGSLRMPPQPVGETERLVKNLERLARYQQVMALENPDRGSELAGRVKVDLLRAPPAPPQARTDPASFVIAEPEISGGSVTMEEGDRIAFRIHNNSGEDLYLNAINLGLTGRVQRFYPNNTKGVLVAPGSFLIRGYFDLYIPDDFPFSDDRYGPRQDEGTDVYKFIFTREPTNLSFLHQDAFDAGEGVLTRSAGQSALEFLARNAAFGTRDITFTSTESADADWAVVDKVVALRRKRSWSLVEEGGKAELEGITVVTSGLSGSVTAHGWKNRRVVAEQAAAALDQALEASGMQTAATMEIQAEAPRTRGGEPSLSFEVDDPGEGWGQVLLSADEAGVLRFHFGEEIGGATRSVGVGAPGRRLRYTVPGAILPMEEEPRTRGLVGALGKKFVKLLVFHAGEAMVKAAGQSLAATWERNRVPYRVRSFTPENFGVPEVADLGSGEWDQLRGGLALLMVHGTFSRTDRAFGGFDPQVVAELHNRYQGRVFSFDHHTRSKTPTENIQKLLQMLPGGAPLELDVVAHSRGGLVARRLATAGDPRITVRRVVFAGTPNGGTAMASPAHINRLLDVYANLLTFFPDNGVTDAMQGLLAVVQDVVLGMVDGLRGLTSMVPGNEEEQRLEGEGWTGRYYALASDFSPTQFGLKSFMDPLASQVFRGAGNDLVVPADSVWKGPEAGPFPLEASAVELFGAGDGVGHSGYFGNPRAVTRLMEWLA
jgi:hypothetical protein